jgi:hypothetical protein
VSHAVGNLSGFVTMAMVLAGQAATETQNISRKDAKQVLSNVEGAAKIGEQQFQKWKRDRNLLLEHGRHEKRANSHRHPP